MLTKGVRLYQFQLVAVERFSCNAELAIFGMPYVVMDANSRHDHFTNAKGRQFAVQAGPDRFGCEFNYDQVFHRCPPVYRTCDRVFHFPGGIQQIGHRAIMELVPSNKNRETN